jgi:hypothetical protein
MTARHFGNACSLDSEFNGVLQILFREMVAAGLARTGIDGKFCSRENILPRP